MPRHHPKDTKVFWFFFSKKNILFSCLPSVLVPCALAVSPCLATAQSVDGARPGNVIGTGMSLPRSDKASNLDAHTTSSSLAPNLPAPQAGEEIQTLLIDARTALQAGRTGEAQEALERAETRALDRSVPAGDERFPAQDSLVHAISEARASLAAGNVAGAMAVITASLPRAADADVP